MAYGSEGIDPKKLTNLSIVTSHGMLCAMDLLASVPKQELFKHVVNCMSTDEVQELLKYQTQVSEDGTPRDPDTKIAHEEGYLKCLEDNDMKEDEQQEIKDYLKEHESYESNKQ